MQPAPGPLLASGRDCDVFVLPGGRVLRRYRSPRDTLREAAVMEHVRGHDYPCPAVHEATATDLVLDLVDGPTMLADLARHPWRLGRHARTLAGLHTRLHRIPSLPDLRAAFGDGGSTLHLDLHPENVILTRRGPAVIDWTNAARGPGAADVAMTWVLLATSEVPGPRAQRVVGSLGRRAFLATFLRHTGRREAAGLLAAVGAARLDDPNVLDEERASIRRLLSREARRSPRSARPR